VAVGAALDVADLAELSTAVAGGERASLADGDKFLVSEGLAAAYAPPDGVASVPDDLVMAAGAESVEQLAADDHGRGSQRFGLGGRADRGCSSDAVRSEAWGVGGVFGGLTLTFFGRPVRRRGPERL
jgi:hypothetical protein